MHVTVTAGTGSKLRTKHILDPHPWCRNSEILEIDDDGIRLLMAMLAGDLLIKKAGLLHQDDEPRFHLYGQLQTESEVWTIDRLVSAALIEAWPEGATSPAVIPYRVTAHGFNVAKEIRTFREAAFANA